MSLFESSLFGYDFDSLGQVTLPEPASDALIRELAVTGGRPRSVEPSTSFPDPAKPSGGRAMLASAAPFNWAPYVMGGGAVLVGLLLWSAIRRPTPNRKRRRSR